MCATLIRTDYFDKVVAYRYYLILYRAVSSMNQLRDSPMSSTLTCPSCSAETLAEYNFCTVCKKQTKCLNPDCNKKLVPGETFCFYCGQALAAITTAQTQPNKYIRSIKQQGKNYEEHTELTASDHAVSELAPFIVGQMASRPPQKPYYPSSSNNSTMPPRKAAVTNDLFAESEELPQLPADNPHAQKTELTKGEASHYFEQDGDFLVAAVKDFKGKNWADQQRYFILLYVSAFHYYFEKPVPPKEHFKIAAQKASVLDPTNFPKYLNELTPKYLSEIGGGYKLNHDGEKEVKHIIALMEDKNVDGGYEYWGRSASSATRRQRLSKEEMSKLREWAQEDVELEKLEVRDIKKARDYAMVSLWIITVHLKKVKAVRWNDAYYFFKGKYKTISATPQGFSRAMANFNNAKYFRESDELYFLSSEGQRKVEDWRAGKPFESSSEAEDDTDD